MTALEALNLAAPLADTYTEVEQRLLVKIARQLTLNDTHDLNEVSKWQIKQLAQMGMLKKDAAKIINSMTKGLSADYADTIQAAIEATLAEDALTSMWENEEFSESAKQTIKHYRNQAADVYNQVNTVMQYKAGSSYVRAVNSVAEKMTEEMRRLQKEVGNKQDFLDTLNSNTAAVVSGTTARTKAVRDTIHEMAQKGIPAFVDKLGREWSPEAYVNMDIRNTVKNTATSAAFGAMDALDQDVFEVSSHPGSRPKCRPWQGKFISRSGRTTEITDLNGRKYKVYPLSQTSYGEPDGLFGINCGHRPRGVSDGLFTRTSKTSEEYGSDDEELYYKVCKQRELERKVRKSKTEADMLDAAGDPEGARTVRQKANQHNKELKGFCQQNGLKYRTDRVRSYGSVKPAKNTSAVVPVVEKPVDLRTRYDDLKKQYLDDVKIAEKLKTQRKELEAKVFFGDGGTDEEMKRLRQMGDELKAAEAKASNVKAEMLNVQKEYAEAASKRLVDDGIFEIAKLPKTMVPSAVDEIESKARTLYSEYGIMPKKLLHDPMKTGGAPATYYWDDEIMYLGNGALDPERFAEHHKKAIDAFNARQSELRSLYEEQLADAEKILSNKKIKGYERHKAKEMKEDALIQLNQVRTTVPDTIGEVFEHEYAHFLHDKANHISGIYERKKSIGLKQLHGEPDMWNTNNKSGKVAAASVSRYATENPMEAIAESFVARRKGYAVPDVLDDILDDIDNIVGKSLDKSAGSGIMETRKADIVNGKNVVGIWKRRNSFDYAIDDIIDYQGYNGRPTIVYDRAEFDKYVEEDHFLAERTFCAETQATIDLYDSQLKAINGEDYFHVNCEAGGAQYGQGMYCAADYTKGTISYDRFEHEIDQYTWGRPYSKTNWMTLDPSAKVLEIPSGYDRTACLDYVTNLYQERYRAFRLEADSTLKEHWGDYQKRMEKIRPLYFGWDESDWNKADKLVEKLDKKYPDIRQLINDINNCAANKNSGILAAEMGYDAINAQGHGKTDSYTVVLNRTKLIIYGGENYEYNPK